MSGRRARPVPAHVGVVGGRGWLGQAIVRAAVARGLAVTVISRTPGPGVVAYEHGHVGSLARALGRCDVVINAGGYRGDDPRLATEANYDLADSLGQLAAERGLRLVHLGSAAEYGRVDGEEPVAEDHACLPSTLHGLTKLAGAQALLRWRARGAHVTVARAFAVVAADMPTGNPVHDLAEKVRALAGHPERGSGVVGIGDPATTRDITRRAWLAAAIVALATAPWKVTPAPSPVAAPIPAPDAHPAEPAPVQAPLGATSGDGSLSDHPVVNVCTGRATSYRDLVEAMASHLGVEVNVLDLGGPRGGRLVGDPTLLRSLVALPSPDRVEDLVRSIVGPAGGLPWRRSSAADLSSPSGALSSSPRPSTPSPHAPPPSAPPESSPRSMSSRPESPVPSPSPSTSSSPSRLERAGSPSCTS